MNPGGQAEGARVPYADTNLFKIPSDLDDEQVLFLTDILPTGAMGADLAEVPRGYEIFDGHEDDALKVVLAT